MKRFLPAALLLLLGSGAWGQSQPGVGLSISPVPGAGSNAGASTLRMDLGGFNPAAPASSSLGLALSPSLSLSPKVSPAAPAAQAAAHFVPTSRAAHAETGARFSQTAGAARTSQQKDGVLSSSRRSALGASRIGNSRETETLSPVEHPRAEQTPREESPTASAVLKDLAASPLEHRRAFDGEARRPRHDAAFSSPDGETGLSPRTDSLLRPHAAGADAGRIDTPSPLSAAPAAGDAAGTARAENDPRADPEPFTLPLWKRALAVTGILGFLAAVPSLLNAAALQTVGQAILPSVSAGSVLSIFTQNAVLLMSPWAWGVAGVLALVGLPLRIFVFRLSPWSMHWLKDPGNGLAKKPLWVLLPLLAVAAASEELAFRAMAFGLSFVFLSTLMAAPLALAAASFFSSLVFALIHGYGPVWTRVVGGMLYSAAFAVTGSLLFITLAHMLFNLRALSLARRSNGQ